MSDDAVSRIAGLQRMSQIMTGIEIRKIAWIRVTFDPRPLTAGR
jgi:hypothetical protein